MFPIASDHTIPAMHFVKPRDRFYSFRFIYVFSLVFVFCHIAFDVLDLDLSNFPLNNATHESGAIITTAPEAAELVKTVKADGFRTNPSFLEPVAVNESVR